MPPERLGMRGIHCIREFSSSRALCLSLTFLRCHGSGVDTFLDMAIKHYSNQVGKCAKATSAEEFQECYVPKGLS